MASEIYYYHGNGLNQLVSTALPNCVLDCMKAVECHVGSDLSCMYKIDKLRESIFFGHVGNNQSSPLLPIMKTIKFAIHQMCSSKGEADLDARVAVCSRIIESALFVYRHEFHFEGNNDAIIAGILCKIFGPISLECRLRIGIGFGKTVVRFVEDFFEGSKRTSLPHELTDKMKLIVQNNTYRNSEGLMPPLAINQNTHSFFSAQPFVVELLLDDNILLKYIGDQFGGLLKTNEEIIHIPEHLISNGFFLKSNAEQVYRIPDYHELQELQISKLGNRIQLWSTRLNSPPDPMQPININLSFMSEGLSERQHEQIMTTFLSDYRDRQDCSQKHRVSR
jgi:hypothetical protein